jgi:peptidoglycan/LPS O-acetylase OafA/YrhL
MQKPTTHGNQPARISTTHVVATQGTNAPKLIWLEYLRAYAFLNVLVTHLFQNYLTLKISESAQWPIAGLETLYNAIAPTLFGGATGVIVFFLVSGYIIFTVSERESPGTFLVRRLFRIYPLYIVAVILQFAITDRSIPPWESLRPRLSLLGDFTGTDHVLNGVDWTLRIEFVFYIFVFLTAFLNTSKASKNLKPMLLPVIVFICFVTPPFPASPNTINMYFSYFMVGAAVYFYEKNRVSLLFLLLITTAALFTSFGKGSLLGIVIFFSAWITRDRLAHSRAVVSLAGVSYAIYLFHAWFYNYMEKLLGTMTRSEVFASIASLAILFGVCYLLHFTVEKPFIAAGRYLSRMFSTRSVTSHTHSN